MSACLATLARVVQDVKAGRSSREQAILALTPEALDRHVYPTLRHDGAARILARGMPASRGAAAGRACFTAAEALACSAAGDPAILLANRVSTDEVSVLGHVAGVLAPGDDPAGHAAIVAAGMGRPFIVGCPGLQVAPIEGRFSGPGWALSRGDWLALDGFTGEILAGRLAVVAPALPDEYADLSDWLSSSTRLEVKANADTVREFEQALAFGAVGFEPRTEHMFLEPDQCG